MSFPFPHISLFCVMYMHSFIVVLHEPTIVISPRQLTCRHIIRANGCSSEWSNRVSSSASKLLSYCNGPWYFDQTLMTCPFVNLYSYLVICSFCKDIIFLHLTCWTGPAVTSSNATQSTVYGNCWKEKPEIYEVEKITRPRRNEKL